MPRRGFGTAESAGAPAHSAVCRAPGLRARLHAPTAASVSRPLAPPPSHHPSQLVASHGGCGGSAPNTVTAAHGAAAGIAGGGAAAAVATACPATAVAAATGAATPLARDVLGAQGEPVCTAAYASGGGVSCVVRCIWSARVAAYTWGRRQHEGDCNQ